MGIGNRRHSCQKDRPVIRSLVAVAIVAVCVPVVASDGRSDEPGRIVIRYETTNVDAASRVPAYVIRLPLTFGFVGIKLDHGVLTRIGNSDRWRVKLVFDIVQIRYRK
jgi:hypothetical protein